MWKYFWRMEWSSLPSKQYGSNYYACNNIPLSWCACVDIHALSLGAIIAVAVSCVVFLGMALVLFGLRKKIKSSQPRSKLTIGAPVVNNPQSGYIATPVLKRYVCKHLFLWFYRLETQVNHQPKAAFHCNPTNDVHKNNS